MHPSHLPGAHVSVRYSPTCLTLSYEVHILLPYVKDSSNVSEYIWFWVDQWQGHSTKWRCKSKAQVSRTPSLRVILLLNPDKTYTFPFKSVHHSSDLCKHTDAQEPIITARIFENKKSCQTDHGCCFKIVTQNCYVTTNRHETVFWRCLWLISKSKVGQHMFKHDDQDVQCSCFGKVHSWILGGSIEWSLMMRDRVARGRR